MLACFLSPSYRGTHEGEGKNAPNHIENQVLGRLLEEGLEDNDDSNYNLEEEMENLQSESPSYLSTNSSKNM
jgi:hypothetical protein